MADLFIAPGRLQGKVSPPASKSQAHRALIAAALSGQSTLVSGLGEPLSDDIKATKACLTGLFKPGSVLDCAESGTSLRLLLPLAGAVPEAGLQGYTFTGQGRLPRRPLGDYARILAGAGLELSWTEPDYLPLQVKGRLRPGTYAVPGDISSQYISGLLFALPLLPADSEIVLTSALESAPYVDMTLAVLEHFAIRVHQTPRGYFVPGRQIYQPRAITIEKDYSQAAFWLVAAYGGCPLEVCQLPDKTSQGDRAIKDILKEFSQGTGPLAIDVAQIPDLVPILAVAAALTPRQIRLVNATRLRYKESDRLLSTQSALAAIGADIKIVGDELEIQGRPETGLAGGTADSWGDHRIAMALAVAALFSKDGLVLQNAEVVNKSYPDFFTEFRRLGGVADELNLG